ncbi:hypothetical protein FNV43_RR04538 [Rhamnella rubrinervis]|uniref:Uncharacterized protein n=1 Tax=Rhamnella rubrinervis TaxID=2594499 RepID=A0A8K0HKE3_9ROSA|nr:hypothetical protein FNV43_RR04538 [Rhamnella rubrinervis]
MDQFFAFGLKLRTGTNTEYCYRFHGIGIYSWGLLMSKGIFLLFGAAVCVLGLGLVLLSDAGVGGGGGSKPLLGDILVIAGTVFFAMSNVGEEFCVKKKDRIEVVSMIGVYGFLERRWISSGILLVGRAFLLLQTLQPQ